MTEQQKKKEERDKAVEKAEKENDKVEEKLFEEKLTQKADVEVEEIRKQVEKLGK